MTATNPAPAVANGRPEVPDAKPYPLSPQQRRLWRVGPWDPGCTAQIAVRIAGPLEAERIEAAARLLVERHDILRTTFREEEPEGRVQSVAAAAEPAWECVDLTGLPASERDREVARMLAQERREPPDPSRASLLRLTLVRLDTSDHALVLTLPALCADGHTLRALVRDLAALYDERPPAAPSLQHGDLAVWQNGLSEAAGPDHPGRAFWRAAEVSAALEPDVAPLSPSPSETFDVELVRGDLDPAVVDAIDTHAAASGTTSRAFLLACWQVVTTRLAAGSPVATGVLFDGRPYPELEDALGPIARYLPVWHQLDEEETLTAAVRRVDSVLASAHDWQECFEWRDALGQATAEPRAVAVCFDYASELEEEPAGDCTFRVADQYASVDRFGVRLTCRRGSAGIGLELHYDPGALPRAEAGLVLERFAELAGTGARAPDAPVRTLRSLTPAEEHRLLVELNDTAREGLDDGCAHELIADQARRVPDEVAVAAGDERVTFAELDARANRLAHALLRHGAGPESRVGVLLERSAELVVALLAVLKAGAAYVPLDASHPPARLDFQVRDAGLSILVTDTRHERLVPTGSARVLRVDAERQSIEREPGAAPAVRVHRDNLAYVIYTSGSTGAPKGVMVTHGGLANYLRWAVDFYATGDGGGAPVHSPIAFDLTVTALFPPLIAGRTAVLVPEADGVDGLAALLAAESDFSLAKLTPSHLHMLSHLIPPDRAAGAARAFVVGGEPLTTDAIGFWREHAPALRIFNEYGPTETVVGCSVHEVTDSGAGSWRVPIGHPIANTRLYVLDRYMNPVPPGVPGELYVGGAGVARGYLSRPALTAERFVPDPFADAPGARLYRTGDLVRRLDDGSLEFLERIDRQVKVRGFRVEPGEVESVLAEHDAVQRAAVVTLDDDAGARLVAYCSARLGARPTAEELTAFLAERLPAFMVPDEVVVLDVLPLTANGKVDLAALPQSTRARREYVAPRSAIEQVMAGIWSEVLGVDAVGTEDNFFELGGQSMSAARVVFLVRDSLQADLPLRAVFETPTIAGLSAALAPGAAERERLERTARVALEVARLSDDDVEASLAERRGGSR